MNWNNLCLRSTLALFRRVGRHICRCSWFRGTCQWTRNAWNFACWKLSSHAACDALLKWLFTMPDPVQLLFLYVCSIHGSVCMSESISGWLNGWAQLCFGGHRGCGSGSVHWCHVPQSAPGLRRGCPVWRGVFDSRGRVSGDVASHIHSVVCWKISVYVFAIAGTTRLIRSTWARRARTDFLCRRNRLVFKNSTLLY